MRRGENELGAKYGSGGVVATDTLIANGCPDGERPGDSQVPTPH